MDFYGDDVRWFLGRVVDFQDQWKGRVKVRILGLHSENILDEDLPWAKCLLPTTEGGTSGIGKIPQVLNNAFVFGIFLDGKLSQNPLVLGSLNHFELPSFTQKQQIIQSGRDYSLSAEYAIDGVILDPNLVTLYSDGTANLETRTIIAMQFLLDAGIASPEAAAGVVGNLIGESNILPDGPRGSAGEEGIAQWNPKVGRLQMLREFAKERNENYLDFFTQLKFLVYDMKNNGAHRVWPDLSDKSISHEYNVDIPYEQQKKTNATYLFLKVSEQPASIATELVKRQGHAQFAYDAYAESLRVTRLAAASAAPAGGVI